MKTNKLLYIFELQFLRTSCFLLYVVCYLRAHKVYEWSTFLHYSLPFCFFFFLFLVKEMLQSLYLWRVNYRTVKNTRKKNSNSRVLLKMKPYFGPSSSVVFVLFWFVLFAPSCALTRSSWQECKHTHIIVSYFFFAFFFARKKEMFCCRTIKTKV